jgi:hypothetical protein
MGVTASTPVVIKEKQHFGSVYGNSGKLRPGYYIKNGIVVYKGQRLELLPGETDFQKMKYGYLKTNYRVFYKGQQIPHANPVTFTVLNRNNVSKLSKYPEKNNEFEKFNSVLGMDFIGNEKRIYLGQNLIHKE